MEKWKFGTPTIWGEPQNNCYFCRHIYNLKGTNAKSPAKWQYSSTTLQQNKEKILGRKKWPLRKNITSKKQNIVDNSLVACDRII